MTAEQRRGPSVDQGPRVFFGWIVFSGHDNRGSPSIHEGHDDRGTSRGGIARLCAVRMPAQTAAGSTPRVSRGTAPWPPELRPEPQLHDSERTRGLGHGLRTRAAAPARRPGHDRLHGQPAAGAGRLSVASFQQRGVAPSTLAGPFDVATLRDDVIAVLDTLGWGTPAMIGHSWGGHLPGDGATAPEFVRSCRDAC